MTDPAILAGVNVVHSDLNRTLLHSRKGVLVVAVFALAASVPVESTIKGNDAHGTFAEFKGLSRRYGQSKAGA